MLFRMPKSMRNRLPTPTPTAPSSVRVSRCTAFNGPLFSLSSFDLSSASLAMSVFLKGEEKKAFASLEEGLCDRRKSDVANAWFKVSLTQRKRRLACDDIVSLLENDEDLQKDLAVDKEGGRKNEEKNRLMPTLSSQKNSKRDSEKEHQGPYKGLALLARLAELANSSISVALDKGVAIILGLSNSGQTSGSVDVPEVPLSAFTKAFRMLIHAHKSRAEWWKKESEQNVDDNVNVANTGNAGNEKAPEEDPVVKSVKNATDLTGYESALLSCIVDPNELATAFEDVCISEKTVDTLRTITSLRLRFPSAFTSGVLSRESMGGVLLYGPPGTGKTMVCRAVARESGARMLVIKPSDVMDKCLGESEKRVKAIFGLAYRLAPCLIFVDELDSLFGKRKEDDQKWYRDILAEFLQSMDGLKSAKENTDAVVILIGATNRPQDIDEAVIRRLPSRMMVDAPDEKQRQRILELHLRGETLDEDVKLSEIAAKTTNYSGSDLKNVCVSAAMASVKEAIGIFTWEPIKSKDVPKAGDDSTPGGAQGDEETKKSNEKIDKRTVKMCHLMAALAEVSGSLSNSSTGQSELQRWHSQFGAGASSRPSYVAGHTRPGGYSGAGSYGSKPGGYTGAGNYGSGGNAMALVDMVQVGLPPVLADMVWVELLLVQGICQ
ncbi:P-loop containing nucleoside triphosphate hydrolase protein [Cyathus striatus]|nr:P-loop containing nucleoside triphosphate hydrolase protein [Cyathus striatus]